MRNNNNRTPLKNNSKTKQVNEDEMKKQNKRENDRNGEKVHLFDTHSSPLYKKKKKKKQVELDNKTVN